MRNDSFNRHRDFFLDDENILAVDNDNDGTNILNLLNVFGTLLNSYNNEFYVM